MSIQRIASVATAIYLGVMLAFGWLVHEGLMASVLVSAEQANRSFTRLFVNENWDRLKPLLQLGRGSEEIIANPRLDEVDRVIRRFTRGTDLVHAKIFDARGVVVYATDKSQLGLDKSTSTGVISAIKGKTATELSYKDQFRGFENDLHDRDMVSSYVPVIGSAGIEAVVEIYTDRTDARAAVEHHWRRIMAWVGLSLAGVLAWFVWTFARVHKANLADEQANARLLQQQREATYELVCAEQEKLRILWGVTQELKSLINALSNTLRQMAPPMVSGTAAKLLQVAFGQAKAIHQRMQEFRTVVRLNRGVLQVDSEVFHLGELVRQVGDLLKASAAGRPLETLVHVAPQVDQHYVGDPQRIRDVLMVLLNNALDVTSSGSIQLRALPSPDGVSIDVVDTGPGLSDLDLRGFADSQRRQTYLPSTHSADLEVEDAHVSLGLIMAQGLAKLMGGHLDVRSQPGHGAWFTLSLPLSRASGAQQ